MCFLLSLIFFVFNAKSCTSLWWVWKMIFMKNEEEMPCFVFIWSDGEGMQGRRPSIKEKTSRRKSFHRFCPNLLRIFFSRQRIIYSSSSFWIRWENHSDSIKISHSLQAVDTIFDLVSEPTGRTLLTETKMNMQWSCHMFQRESRRKDRMESDKRLIIAKIDRRTASDRWLSSFELFSLIFLWKWICCRRKRKNVGWASYSLPFCIRSDSMENENGFK